MSSKHHRRLKFNTSAYFNQTKRNPKKKKKLTSPKILTLHRVKICNLSSKHHRRLKFNTSAYFNQTKRNLKKKIWPPPKILTLNRVEISNLGSKHHSLYFKGEPQAEHYSIIGLFSSIIRGRLWESEQSFMWNLWCECSGFSL